MNELLLKHGIGYDVRVAARMRGLGGEVRRVGTTFHPGHPFSWPARDRPHDSEFAPAPGVPNERRCCCSLSHGSEQQISERVWGLR